MFDWLSDTKTIEVLGFYGGGVSTVIGAFWVIYIKLFSKKNTAPPKISQKAEHGIAAGGDIQIHGNVAVSSGHKAPRGLVGLGLIGLAWWITSLVEQDATQIGSTITNNVIDRSTVINGDVRNACISNGVLIPTALDGECPVADRSPNQSIRP